LSLLSLLSLLSRQVVTSAGEGFPDQNNDIVQNNLRGRLT